MSLLEPIQPALARSTRSEDYLCWSRMQAEAGQTLEAIIERKERERRAGQGLFLWGVGNAPATAIRKLALLRMPIPIVFSTMKSKPKPVDVAPGRTVVWRRYVGSDGVDRPLPASAVVTSRGDSAGGAKTKHYALMCRSNTPLTLTRGIPFDPCAFRNVGGAGAPVGASQVTALLRQVAEPDASPSYEANLVAWLTDGYWVRLCDPLELSARAIEDIASATAGTDEWLAMAARVRGMATRGDCVGDDNLLL